MASAPFAVAQTPPGGGYTIQPLGLTGAAYQYSGGGQTKYVSILTTLDPSGQVSGVNARFGLDGSAIGSDAWFFNGTTTQLISLTGPAYEYTDANGTKRYGAAFTTNTLSGGICGYSERYDSSPAFAGQDSWYFNGTTTQVIGPTGAGYSYISGSGVTIRESYPMQMTDTGIVCGRALLFNSAGLILGEDIWRYNGTSTQLISLSGGVNEYTDAAGAHRSGGLAYANASGQACGDNSRFAAGGSDLGADAWFYNGTTTQVVGLSGGNYEYAAPAGTYRNSYGTGMFDNGNVFGSSGRWSAAGVSLGNDVWRYNGTTSIRVNPIGSEYEYIDADGLHRDGNINTWTDANQIIGYSTRYAADGSWLGVDAWVNDGAGTRVPGLTGAEYELPQSGGIRRIRSVESVNPSGVIAGISYRAPSGTTDLGADAYIDNGTSSQRINLTGGRYEYIIPSAGTYRYAGVGQVLSNGKVTGTSRSYAPDGTQIGQDAWLYDGTTTKRINPTGGAFEYTDGSGNVHRDGNFNLSYLQLENGKFVGTAARYTPDGSPLGEVGWLYDDADDEIFPMDFSLRTDGYSWSHPMRITGEGVVLGEYDLYSGMSLVGRRAFWWSEDAGFRDLGALVQGGLSASGWAELDYPTDFDGVFTSGSPLFLTGDGLTTGQTDGSTAFLLTAQAPEPASIALLAPAALLMLRRRR